MNNVKKSIKWADYTLNPVKGKCPVGCPYCYAEQIRKRFHRPSEISYDATVWPEKIKFGSKVFVGSTIDLFHDKTIDYMRIILAKCAQYPDVTFQFLTKCPENLHLFSPYPDNCWIGVSATNYKMASDARYYLDYIKSKVKFISFEPLLEPITDLSLAKCPMNFIGHTINWIIIGQQTPVRKSTMPKNEWIRDIVEAADQSGIPVFMKDNLYPVFAHPNIPDWYDVPKWAHANHGINILRQEFPGG